MKQIKLNQSQGEQDHKQAPVTTPIIGRIADHGGSGKIMVSCRNNPPKPARILSGLDRKELCKAENIGRDVLVVFEDGDPNLPIIIGLMESVLEDLVSVEIQQPAIPQKKLPEAKLDGKRVVLEAENEIRLKCGKGSITVKKDGKIIIKGTELLSRASGSNRIKGTSISIN